MKEIIGHLRFEISHCHLVQFAERCQMSAFIYFFK